MEFCQGNLLYDCMSVCKSRHGMIIDRFLLVSDFFNKSLGSEFTAFFDPCGRVSEKLKQLFLQKRTMWRLGNHMCMHPTVFFMVFKSMQDKKKSIWSVVCTHRETCASSFSNWVVLILQWKGVVWVLKLLMYCTNRGTKRRMGSYRLKWEHVIFNKFYVTTKHVFTSILHFCL